MDRPSLLVLVRHAESARNAAKKGNTYFADDYARNGVAGVPDQKIKITPDGALYSQKTGAFLRRKFGLFDYVYDSGYDRTIMTRENILLAYTEEERARMNVRHNLFIRERHAGHTYDMTESEAEAAFSWLKEYWKTHGGFMACPPGGESLANVSERVYLFLNMLFRDRTGERVLAITHGGTLRCFRYLLEHWNYEQAEKWPEGDSPKNCGVTYYEFDHSKKRLVLKGYNLTWEDE